MVDRLLWLSGRGPASASAEVVVVTEVTVVATDLVDVSLGRDGGRGGSEAADGRVTESF
jgi:hypothetical protein